MDEPPGSVRGGLPSLGKSFYIPPRDARHTPSRPCGSAPATSASGGAAGREVAPSGPVHSAPPAGDGVGRGSPRADRAGRGASLPRRHARGGRRRDPAAPRRGRPGAHRRPRRPRPGAARVGPRHTDVLTWWGHCAHDEVDDALVERVHARVLAGMGLVVLHSGPPLEDLHAG